MSEGCVSPSVAMRRRRLTDRANGHKNATFDTFHGVHVTPMSIVPTSMEKLSGILCFAVRCSLSAVLAYVVALRLGLPYPVWAPMSALIVSQEDLKTTRHAVTGRIAGTALGVAIAMIVAKFGDVVSLSEWVQLSLGVGICALCAKGRPAMRVSLWTCPLVLLTQIPSLSTEMTGLFRGSEVIIGAIVGGLAHLVEDWLRRLAARLFRRGPTVRSTGDNRSWWTRDSEE